VVSATGSRTSTHTDDRQRSNQQTFASTAATKAKEDAATVPKTAPSTSFRDVGNPAAASLPSGPAAAAVIMCRRDCGRDPGATLDEGGTENADPPQKRVATITTPRISVSTAEARLCGQGCSRCRLGAAVPSTGKHEFEGPRPPGCFTPTTARRHQPTDMTSKLKRVLEEVSAGGSCAGAPTPNIEEREMLREHRVNRHSTARKSSVLRSVQHRAANLMLLTLGKEWSHFLWWC